MIMTVQDVNEKCCLKYAYLNQQMTPFTQLQSDKTADISFFNATSLMSLECCVVAHLKKSKKARYEARRVTETKSLTFFVYEINPSKKRLKPELC
jgi:hypothetical protein